MTSSDGHPDAAAQRHRNRQRMRTLRPAAGRPDADPRAHRQHAGEDRYACFEAGMDGFRSSRSTAKNSPTRSPASSRQHIAA
jgi:hypothetical protein